MTQKKNLLKKIKKNEKCKNLDHDFVITKWYQESKKQKAVEMRCTHCLISVSLEEIESLEWQQRENIQ